MKRINTIYKQEISNNFRVSLCSASHIGKNKQENQDAIRVGVDEQSGAVFMAVADGLGSCSKSAEGAEKAVYVLESWVRNDLSKYARLSQNVANILRKKVLDRWKKELNDRDISKYDTTLHYAIFYKNILLVGGIGDGMLLSQLDQEESIEHISSRSGFSNITNSLASECVYENFEDAIIDCAEIQNRVVVIIATDGISEDIIDEKKQELVKYFWDTYREKGIDTLHGEIEEWIQNWKTIGHSDDKTIAIMIGEKVEG